MFSRNAIMATLVILSIILFATSTTNALAITNEKDINDVQGSNYTITDDAVILHSLVGDIPIPIPEEIKAELKKRREENSRNEEKRFERLTYFDNNNVDGGMRSKEIVDFFECNDQAQIALSPTRENFRIWEAFFKRNTISNTVAVRYCCNLLEFVDNAQMDLSPGCRDRVRLQDQVMTNLEIRSTCRKYEFHSAECFLVRWMYWWIPVFTLILICLGISFVCCCMKSRRSRSYSKTREEEKKFRTSLVTGI